MDKTRIHNTFNCVFIHDKESNWFCGWEEKTPEKFVNDETKEGLEVKLKAVIKNYYSIPEKDIKIVLKEQK